jgi:type I restriction enzyme S subunit
VIEDLPDSWCRIPLEDVALINPGVDKSRFSNDEELPFVPMPAVEAGTGRIDTSERRPFGKLKSGFTAFASSDVLFAKITPCMENGKMAVVPKLPKGVGFGTTEFHVLRATRAVDPRLLYYFVSSASVRHEAQHNMTGAVGQKRVPKRYVEKKEFPLPPLNEQHRIVEKIESLFAQIDKGEEALREVQKLLKRYRQSILKAAVTGSLIGCDWQDLEEVPLGDLLLDIRYGTAKKCGRDSSQTPVLRIPNVVSDEIDLSDLKYAELSDTEYDKLSLRRGDILVVRSNGSANLVARGAIVDENAVGCAYAGYLIRLRIDQARITPQFLKLVLDSPQMRSVIELQARSTSGVHNINSTEIKNLSIPLPSLDEQRAVAKRVEGLFTDTQSLEVMCKSELSRSGSLRQSILRSAFTGQLTPQDPNDEPASELLARIRAERDAAPVKKRSKKKSSSKQSRAKA